MRHSKQHWDSWEGACRAMVFLLFLGFAIPMLGAIFGWN